MTRPTVGIITTVYSYERFLFDWSKSIRALERQPDKIVVAAHNAKKVVDILAVELPQAIVVPISEDFTFSNYLNQAVEACDTDWVAWVGADDRYRPTAFNGIDDCTADIFAFGMRYSDGRVWVYNNDFHHCLNHNPVTCGSPFRRWIWEQLPFQSYLSPFEDWAFWVGAYKLQAKIQGTNRVDFDYTCHPDQTHPPQEPTASNIRAWAQTCANDKS